MPGSNIVIEPLRFQCQCIGFSEWISLFTLCLAPLIAHLISGTPTTSYLTDRRPKWYDRLCSYNPTSIIWRYAAITDRRIRAIQWSRHDLAATNAIFWTSDGWNGGEEMVTTSATYCLRYPESTRVEILSLTMLKTVITTLQGVSAFYILIGGVAGVALPDSGIGFGVDTLFFPLSILGLLRLCAAAWLTDDFVYQGDGLRNTSTTETAGPVRQSTMAKHDDIELDHPPRALDPLITMPSETSRFRSPANSWRSRLFRITFLLVLSGVWLIALFITTPALAPADTYGYTMTTFLLGVFYFVFITISLILYTFYFFRGQTTTTIIPCVSSMWYRLYSLLLMAFMIALIIIASIETNKTPVGTYTSTNMGTSLSCIKATRWLVLPQTSRWVGLATEWDLGDSWLSQNKTSLPVKGLQETGPFAQKEYWLYNVTGYCVGSINDM